MRDLLDRVNNPSNGITDLDLDDEPVSPCSSCKCPWLFQASSCCLGCATLWSFSFSMNLNIAIVHASALSIIRAWMQMSAGANGFSIFCPELSSAAYLFAV